MRNYVALFERLYERRPVGVKDEALSAVEERLGVVLPPSLRCFYSACGREPLVMSAHNRFLSPAALECADGRILFCEENQGVCVWGCAPGDGDPMAEVGNVLRDDAFEWHSEGTKLSQFLQVLLYLQTAWGGFEFAGDLQDPKPMMARIQSGWERVVRHQDLTIYWRPGALISALDGEAFLTAATRTQEGFARLEAELGFRSI